MHHFGWKYSVITADTIAPVIPPKPLTIQENACNFSEPCFKSYLDCITIMESAITSIKAELKFASMKSVLTKKIDSNSPQKINCNVTS